MGDKSETVPEKLIKTKQRIADHGEVFTPSHIVEAMLDLVKGESERIDSKFLEPACGEGNFLVQVLVRKLTTVQSRYRRSEFERRHYALLALMSIYGVELLADNAEKCRQNLLAIFFAFINDPDENDWATAARVVVEANIVQADALTMRTEDGRPLTFPEWGYLGLGKYQRRDFQYESLSQRSSYIGTLFGEFEEDQIFVPTVSYNPMTVSEISKFGASDANA